MRSPAAVAAAPLVPVLALALAACMPAEISSVVTRPVSDGLVFVRGGGGNSLVLTKSGRALVVDPKMWPWENDVQRQLRGTGGHAHFVVNTHLHGDHTQANVYHPRSLVFAAPYTAEQLDWNTVAEERPHNPGAVHVPVRRRTTLSVGGERVELIRLGAAHTAGDLAVWFPERRLLATGDVFDHGFYSHIDPRHGGTFVGSLEALDVLCALGAEVVIPGHGAAASQLDLVAYRDWLRALHDQVAAEKRAGASDEAIVEKLSPRAGETYEDLGVFSNRARIVEALVRELGTATASAGD